MRLTIAATASVSSLVAAPGALFLAFIGRAAIPFVGLTSAFVSALIAGFSGGATAFLVFLTLFVFHVRKFLVKSSTLIITHTVENGVPLPVLDARPAHLAITIKFRMAG